MQHLDFACCDRGIRIRLAPRMEDWAAGDRRALPLHRVGRIDIIPASDQQTRTLPLVEAGARHAPCSNRFDQTQAPTQVAEMRPQFNAAKTI